MRFYSYNADMIKPFQILETDDTPKNLTGLTLKWYFVDRDGNQPTGSPITGLVTNATNGQVRFTIPTTIFTVAARYTCQINLSDGVNYDEDTDAFIVDIDNPRQRTS